jgi:hypothetical protein
VPLQPYGLPLTGHTYLLAAAGGAGDDAPDALAVRVHAHGPAQHDLAALQRTDDTAERALIQLVALLLSEEHIGGAAVPLAGGQAVGAGVRQVRLHLRPR